VSAADLVVIALAGFAAGAINAIAGGGSLLLFPVLLWTGLSPLAANVTNTVAALPGTTGGVLGFLPELRGRGRTLLPLAIAGATGSAVGAVLLLALPETAFDVIVPALVLAASLLLAAQPRLTRWLERGRDATRPQSLRAATFGIGLAGVYGGYFGGAMGVILLTVLALTVRDELRALNAQKSALSLVDCTVSAVAFAFVGPVAWAAVAVAAPTGLAGGYLGARVARRVNERALRAVVVTLGVAVAIGLAVT
jgi:uncharacterized membrane protein YfcA